MKTLWFALFLLPDNWLPKTGVWRTKIFAQPPYWWKTTQEPASLLIWLRGFLEWGQAPKPPGFVALRATTHSWPEGNDPPINPENCSLTQIIEQ